MPNVASVNLSYLNTAANLTRVESAKALINLAEFANGPLRLQKKMENGKTVLYLGVRTWSTYFFEKLVATHDQKKNAKIKTQAAIDTHVRTFLNNGGLTIGPNAEDVTATLQSKVLGKSAKPLVIDKAGTDATQPTYRDRSEVIETKGTAYRGTATVHKGLSMAVISPLKVIANVRLVTKATFDSHPASDTRKGKTVSLGEPAKNSRTQRVDFDAHYLAQLNAVAGVIDTSVVLELHLDEDKKCSEDNLEGARSAAIKFTKAQELKGKQVSIMLTVPNLPAVAKNGNPTANVDGSSSSYSEDEV